MPEQEHGRIVETATEARAGTKDKPTRNVLFISTGAVIVAFTLLLLLYFA